MPALPATPSGVIAFRLQFQLKLDTNSVNTFRIAYTGGPPSSADLSTLAGDVATAFDSNLPPYYQSDSSLVEVFARDLQVPSTTEGNAVAGIPGTRTGGQSDISRSAVQFFRPDRTYRGARPKCFWPFGCDNDVSDEFEWGETFRSDLQASLGVFYAALDGLIAGSTHLTVPVCVSYWEGFTVVISPTTGRARNVPTLRTTPLVKESLGIEVTSRLGSQRRRIYAS